MAQTNLIGRTILGYTVSERIGEGAFGTVYKAVKTNVSGQYVRALKHITIPTEKQYNSVLNSMGGDASKADSYFAEMLNNIVSEIRILNDLSENGVQHIVRYYENDIVTTESPKRYDIFILMEYLTPLEDYIGGRDFLVSDVVKLATDVLEGLQACHDNGVIHRDIKDDNIFVSDKGEYRIGDFGVSKVLKDSSRAESLKGTPNFLAPEVYLGKEGYTKSVDLYSLGIVLYRLLNYERNPFLPRFPEQYYSQDEETAFEKRMTGAVPELPALGGEKLGAVILRAIAGREERYQTAEEFLRDLKAAVRDTGGEVLSQSIKMNITAPQAESGEECAKIYRETIGETPGNVYPEPETAEKSEPEQQSINKHLFDDIDEKPVTQPRADIPAVIVKEDPHESAQRDRASGAESSDRPQHRVVERIPIMNDPQEPKVGNSKTIDRVIRLAPVGFVAIAVLLLILILTQKLNNIFVIRAIWYIWLAGFITSLYFLGKQFQRKPEPNAENAILVKKQPYYMAQDISAALKLEYQKNKRPELGHLVDTFKRLEEKFAIESDFGYGNSNVIGCENNIAKQLQYLSDCVPFVSTGELSDNIAGINETIMTIDSLLRKRTELKKIRK